MDIRTLLLGDQFAKAEQAFGKEAVRQEIDDMIFDDLADHALEAAHVLGYRDLANLAASVVRNSGSYGSQARELAGRYA